MGIIFSYTRGLHSCSHVFLPQNAPKPPLMPQYSEPHRVVKRLNNGVYTKVLGIKEVNVTTERLKPVYVANEDVEASQVFDPTRSIFDQTAKRKTYSGPRAKHVRFDV
ncbi:unnamed protein product [Hermetia illucens]|uniref:Uncharacterized protein n=1 Tax=Hermetia illucens TaxID=343691 RepID=A0A7R8UZJ2_HERIL|nr:unnamed protein product [Hermetia illucens]